MIDKKLKLRFEKIIQIENIDWAIVDTVGTSDANVLRPIKGVAFEELFIKIIKQNFPNAIIKEIEKKDADGSDVDLIVNGKTLQLKTINKGNTKENIRVGVALHKTHGDEKRPFNLYKKANPTFDYLVVLHPVSGILIIPYNEIPIHKAHSGYLDDPASFDWNTGWLNRWELLGFTYMMGKKLDNRIVPINSQLPKLSAETFLEDFEIIEMLCKDQYFRAAVMGLKGNLKEFWFKEKMRDVGLKIIEPTEKYAKYDLKIINKLNKEKRVQVKGTSKNMCSIANKNIGFEIMGTHGQFPSRGYKKRALDYVAVVISKDQLDEKYPISDGLHFLMINVNQLPLHYFVNKGIKGKAKGTQNEKWNEKEFQDVLYPNIKLKFELVKNEIHFKPAIENYNTKTIPKTSIFRKVGPFVLNKMPDEF